MKKTIKTAIHIQARPEDVWAILTDFDQYPDWNPFISNIQGNLAEGETLKAQIDGFPMRPKITEVTPNKAFKWLGHLGIRGLFNGAHHFIIDDHGDGTVTFRHEEYFEGILVRLFAKMLDTKTKQGFEAMNQRLKEKAEQYHESKSNPQHPTPPISMADE